MFCSARPSFAGPSLAPIFLNRGPLPGLQDESRLLAVPVRARGRRLVAVVGTSTEARAESQADLAQLLLVGGPVALLLASLAAYGVAAAALRPVEAMRARAAEVSTAEPDQRLPVPPTHDEIARLGVTLNAMLGRLGEALAHERRFVADASHELRTPLAILKTELDLALSQERSPAELRAALASASEETDRLTQLAEDLLTIAQTDQGELPVRLAPTNVGEVLSGVARRFSRRAEEGGRDIEVSVEPGLEVAGDRMRLDQALGNLLDNALRYGSGPVEPRGVNRDGSVELHVLRPRSGLRRGLPWPRLRALQSRRCEQARRRQRPRALDRGFDRPRPSGARRRSPIERAVARRVATLPAAATAGSSELSSPQRGVITLRFIPRCAQVRRCQQPRDAHPRRDATLSAMRPIDARRRNQR